MPFLFLPKNEKKGNLKSEKLYYSICKHLMKNLNVNVNLNDLFNYFISK